MVVCLAETGKSTLKDQRKEPEMSSRQSNLSLEVENMEEDARGRYSVCFKANDDTDLDEVREEFSAAGKVVDVHQTAANLTFVRYLTKEEIQRCLDMFESKYPIRLATARKNDKGFQGSNPPRQNLFETKDTTDGGDRPRRNGPEHVWNRDAGSSPKEDKSHESEILNDVENLTNLFASNIELEDEFRDKVALFKPKTVRVKQNGVKIFAFLEMWNPEDARACIKNLHNTKIGSRQVKITYNHRQRKDSATNENNASQSGSVSEEYSPPSRKPEQQSNNSTKENGRAYHDMPPLEVDPGMPPLVKDSDVYDPDGMYEYDTSVLVTRFPPNTLESEIRKLFKGYRVIDSCVLNNSPHGVTKAVVFFSNLMEAVCAVQEVDGYVFNQQPINVVPPDTNILLKKILLRIETGLREY